MPLKLNPKTSGFLVSITVIGVSMTGLVIGVVALLKRSVSTTYIPVKASELSERSEQFYQKQKATDPRWSSVQLEEESFGGYVQGDNAWYNSDCFRVLVPFRTFNPKYTQDENGCTFSAALIEPRGKIVLGIVKNFPTEISEHSGVKFRRLNSSKYSETSQDFAGYAQSLQFEADDEVTLILKKEATLITLSLSELPANHNQEKIKNQIEMIIQTLTLNL